MSQFPPTYTPASGDEELERLKELIAEAEELCIEYQVEMYCEAQRSQGKIELLSRELEEMKESRVKSGGTVDADPPRDIAGRGSAFYQKLH